MRLNLTVEDLLKATGGILIKGDPRKIINSLSTDSRKINIDDLFLALKGERFDGHDFISEAVKKGAIGVIIDKDIHIYDDVIVIKVKDTLKALQDIANFYRKKLNAKVIGVTGSSGKTTTKDFIGQFLRLKGKVCISRENFNNEIGVPLSILEAEEDAQFLVLEMAMRNKGEIRVLSKLSEPDVGLITNIGWAHIGRLGSKEAIMEAKSEIFEYVSTDGIGVLNADDVYSRRIYEKLKIKKYTFGFDEKSDVRGIIVSKKNDYCILEVFFPNNKKTKIRLPIFPLNIYRNLIAALTVFWIFYPDEVDQVNEISNLAFPKQRLNIKVTKKGVFIIDDTYNANPDSMKTAIEYLEVFRTSGKKVALLGDMLELGDYSIEGHEEVILDLKDKNFDLVVLYGEEMKKVYEEMKDFLKNKNIFCFTNVDDIKNLLKNTLNSSDVVLIKGSRAMQMEKFVNFLEDWL